MKNSELYVWKKMKIFEKYSRDFIFGIVGFIAGSISIFTAVQGSIKSNHGQQTDEIQIVSARFFPMPGFFEPNGENVELQVEVRNFGDNPVLLTSMDAEIKNSTSLKFQAAVFKANVLKNSPEDNKTITIKPGESQYITLHRGIKLEGIKPFMESKDINKECYFAFGKTIFINNNNWVDKFSKELELRFGKNATISISFFENYKKLIKKHDLNLINSQSIGEYKGKLNHAEFLGAAIALNSGEFIFGSQPKVTMSPNCNSQQIIIKP